MAKTENPDADKTLKYAAGSAAIRPPAVECCFLDPGQKQDPLPRAAAHGSGFYRDAVVIPLFIEIVCRGGARVRAAVSKTAFLVAALDHCTSIAKDLYLRLGVVHGCHLLSLGESFHHLASQVMETVSGLVMSARARSGLSLEGTRRFSHRVGLVRPPGAAKAQAKWF
jgi:hypothetical protein